MAPSTEATIKPTLEFNSRIHCPKWYRAVQAFAVLHCKEACRRCGLLTAVLTDPQWPSHPINRYKPSPPQPNSFICPPPCQADKLWTRTPSVRSPKPASWQLQHSPTPTPPFTPNNTTHYSNIPMPIKTNNFKTTMPTSPTPAPPTSKPFSVLHQPPPHPPNNFTPACTPPYLRNKGNIL